MVNIVRNELITLVTIIESHNNRGFGQIESTARREIFAEIRSAGVIEKYEAQRAGIDISIIFKVDTDSYKAALIDGKCPDIVGYDGMTYRICDVRRKKSYANTEIVCKEDNIYGTV